MISFKDLTGARGPSDGEIRIQAGLEFVKQYFQFGVVELALRGNVSRIDNNRAAPFHDVDAVTHEFVDGIIEAESFAMHADSRAF